MYASLQVDKGGNLLDSSASVIKNNNFLNSGIHVIFESDLTLHIVVFLKHVHRTKRKPK